MSYMSTPPPNPTIHNLSQPPTFVEVLAALRSISAVPKIVNILCQFHTGVMVQKTTGEQESTSFPVHTGLR